MRGLFVTGTDTGVGKTVLSAALLAAMARAGEPVRAHKPVVTGLADENAPATPWPADHELLGAAAGMAAEAVAPLRFGPAASPHLAARLAGTDLDFETLVAAARGGDHEARGDGGDRDRGGDDGGGDDDGTIVIVEGVGGLLVPLTDDRSVCDLALALGLPVLVAARPGLGTINHTLLTLAAARAAGLRVRAVVLTPWPEQPSVLERSNRETIARLGAVEVCGLEPVPGP